jgi:uncharacterized protein
VVARATTRHLAVVTGASSGIGAATALSLGERGWRVVLVARREERLHQLAQRIRAVGGEAVVEALDAGDPAAVAAMAERVRAGNSTPRVIVNAAGAGVWRWLEDTPPREMERMLDAPFRAAYHVTHAFMDDLLAQGTGVIVHVGSPASLQPWPSATAYTVSRWALRGLHEALVQDLAGTGVHSCHVLFGEVSSAYFEANPDSYRYAPKLGRLVRTVTPEVCAEVILRTIARPRHQVLHPPMLRVLHLASRLTPGGARWLVRITGRQRR